MQIQHPILALFIYFGAGALGLWLGVDKLASIVVLLISGAYFFRGMNNILKKSPEHKVDWGIFEVDKVSLVVLILFFLFSLTQVDSIESISNWILIILGIIFAYKGTAYYFLKR